MVLRALLVQARLFLFDDQNGVELVCGDLIERQPDAELQRRAQIERPSKELTGFGSLRGIEAVERAVVAAAALGGVGAESGIAQLVSPQRPVDQVAQGGSLGPLPAQEFPSRSSKPASRASIAAFTATAWWMIGTAPA